MKLLRFAPIFLVLAFSPASSVESFDLQPHTLEAFLRYARATEAEFLEQVDSDEFLRIDYPGGIEDSEQALAKVRDGEVYVVKLPKILDNGEEIKVRNGIVHHWYGAALVPDVTLDDVLALVKDYDAHAEVFAQKMTMEIKGRHLIEGVPKTITVTDEEIREALAETVNVIVDAVRVALERTPPELSADIVDRGVVLTGGGSLLKNLDKRLREETGLPLAMAEDPLSSVTLGAGKMLSDFNLLRKISID